MAVVKMQKIGICGKKEYRQEMLLTLQDLAVMEMNFRDIDDIDDPYLKKTDTKNASLKYDKRAESFDRVLALLAEYAPEKKAGLSFFADKKTVTREDMDRAAEERHKYNKYAEKILDAEKAINDSKGIIQKLNNQKAALGPWESLDVPMDLKGTKKVKLLLGTFPRTISHDEVYALAAKDMPEPAAVDVNVISVSGGQTNVSVMCLRQERSLVEDNLRAGGFARVSSPVAGIPSEVILSIDRDILSEEEKIEEKKKEIGAFADQRDDFRLMSDYYRDRAERYRVLGEIPQSGNAFFLEGWVPYDKAEPLKRLLTERFGAYVEMEETKDTDDEPTILKNNAFSESVEGVLESYGLPKHKKADPTFIMSIFYVIFFGMMFSDAGYGILMFLLSFIVLKKKKSLNEGTKKMFKLFMWCGISTAFWGFMYGGFFGDAIDVVAKTFFGYTGETPILKPLWFEPLKNPMRLLVWCMLFGLIHLFFGLGIKGYEYLKEKDIKGFICDILSWYMFITGLVLMLLPSDLFSSIAGASFDFSGLKAIHTPALIITLAGLLIILFMQERGAKNWVLRVLLGAYDIYGVTGWLSDVLSYCKCNNHDGVHDGKLRSGDHHIYPGVRSGTYT